MPTLRAYILHRLALFIPVILGLLIIMFVLTNVVSNPIDAYINIRTTAAQIQLIEEAHHFNDPLYIQFFYYLSSLAHGDWGLSSSMQFEPVTSVIETRFPATAELATAAVLIEVCVGIPLGIASAIRKDRAVDHASRLLAITGSSVPAFILGLALQYVFFYELKILNLPYLPSTGRVDEGVALSHPLHQITGLYILDSLITGNWPFFWSSLAHIILPALTLAFLGLGIITRITRSSMLEVMKQDYIIAARSKGLPERLVIYRHALRNALGPTVTVLGVSLGVTLAGAPITEAIFSWPGIGSWAAGAITSADNSAVLGFVLVTGTVILLANLIVDISYALLDPRIHYG